MRVGVDWEELEPYVEKYCTREKDKLLGWPAWIQGIEYPVCPHCKNKMTYVFQIDSNDNLPYMFGDVGCGHITYCACKRVVAFAWACG